MCKKLFNYPKEYNILIGIQKNYNGGGSGYYINMKIIENLPL